MVETGMNHHDGNSVFKPVIIKSYNSHVGSVDGVDQQLHKILSLRKGYTWYKNFLMVSHELILNFHF